MSASGLGGRCHGCGAPFQHDDPALPGYVPAEVWAAGGEDILCRRCFRAVHYGELTAVGIGDAEYQRAVKAAVDEANLVWVITDIIDFAGSFTPQLLSLAGDKPVVAVANKIDLLPDRAIRSETRAWVQGQVPAGVKVALTSSSTGEGLRDLLATTRALSAGVRAGLVKVAVIGVTNTGKSSLTGRLLSSGGQGVAPTISKFPGTTLGILRRPIPGLGLELLDTPGVIPPGRVSDLLCEECLKAVIPAKGLSSKLFGLDAGQALTLGGLCVVEVESYEGDEAVMVAFAAEGVKLHRTTPARVVELLAPGNEFLAPPCAECQEVISLGEPVSLALRPGEDLAVPGLGWLSVRRVPVKVAVRTPKGVTALIRPALLGPSEGRTPRGAAVRRPAARGSAGLKLTGVKETGRRPAGTGRGPSGAGRGPSATGRAGRRPSPTGTGGRQRTELKGSRPRRGGPKK